MFRKLFDGHIPRKKNFVDMVDWVKTGEYVYVSVEDALRGIIEIDFDKVRFYFYKQKMHL